MVTINLTDNTKDKIKFGSIFLAYAIGGIVIFIINFIYVLPAVWQPLGECRFITFYTFGPETQQNSIFHYLLNSSVGAGEFNIDKYTQVNYEQCFQSIDGNIQVNAVAGYFGFVILLIISLIWIGFSGFYMYDNYSVLLHLGE